MSFGKKPRFQVHHIGCLFGFMPILCPFRVCTARGPFVPTALAIPRAAIPVPGLVKWGLSNDLILPSTFNFVFGFPWISSECSPVQRIKGVSVCSSLSSSPIFLSPLIKLSSHNAHFLYRTGGRRRSRLCECCHGARHRMPIELLSRCCHRKRLRYSRYCVCLRLLRLRRQCDGVRDRGVWLHRRRGSEHAD